jgi:putative membrane protein insertion efficiency factor
LTAQATRRSSPLSRFAERFITTYKSRVAPTLPSRCRFEPTCSQYALASYERHGFLRATAKTAWRVLRCNPWSKGGVNPP